METIYGYWSMTPCSRWTFALECQRKVFAGFPNSWKVSRMQLMVVTEIGKNASSEYIYMQLRVKVVEAGARPGAMACADLDIIRPLLRQKSAAVPFTAQYSE